MDAERFSLKGLRSTSRAMALLATMCLLATLGCTANAQIEILWSRDDAARARENITRFSWARQMLEDRKQASQAIMDLTPESLANALGDNRDVGRLLSGVENAAWVSFVTDDQLYATKAASVLSQIVETPAAAGQLRDAAGRFRVYPYHRHSVGLLFAYAYLYDSPAFTDNAKAFLRDRILAPELAATDETLDEDNNPLIRMRGENEPVYYSQGVSRLVKVMLLSKALQDEERMEQAMALFRQFLAKGAAFGDDNIWWEGSFAYGNANLGVLAAFYPMLLHGLCSPEEEQELSERLFEILNTPIMTLRPDLRLPSKNDSHLYAFPYPAVVENLAFYYGDKEALQLLEPLRDEVLGARGTHYDFGFSTAWETAAIPEIALFRWDYRRGDIPSDPAPPAPLPSIQLPDAGVSLIRSNPLPLQGFRDQAYLLLNYDRLIGSHSHYDRLGIMLYALRHDMLTDYGYKESNHPLRPWMTSALAHNTVVVDEQILDGMLGNVPGVARNWAITPAFKLAEADGVNMIDQDIYAPEEITRFSRLVTMVENPGTPVYVIDQFVVEGGKLHDYVFHANADSAEVDGVDLAAPWPHYGFDEYNLLKNHGYARSRTTVLTQLNEQGGFRWRNTTAGGPGYEMTRGDFIWDAMSGQAASDYSVVWDLKEPKTNQGLVIHYLADTIGGRPTEVAQAVCHGGRVNMGYNTPSPDDNVTNPIVISRREGPRNTFYSVIEPYEGQPSIAGISHQPTADGGVFLSVTLRDGAMNRVLLAPYSDSVTSVEDPVEKLEVRQARMAVVSTDSTGGLRSLGMVNGASLAYAGYSAVASGQTVARIGTFALEKTGDGTYRIVTDSPILLRIPCAAKPSRITVNAKEHPFDFEESVIEVQISPEDLREDSGTIEIS